MIILVTGATSGFGESIAKRFIQQGHKVICTGRRSERLQALGQQSGADFYPLPLADGHHLKGIDINMCGQGGDPVNRLCDIIRRGAECLHTHQQLFDDHP